MKQSDHRPVIAAIDIEARRIDAERRQEVFYEVMADMGPPDGTVIIHCDAVPENEEGTVFDDNLMMALLQELSQIGEVVLVRFVSDTMWVTFRDGQCALEAAAKKSVFVSSRCFFSSQKQERKMLCLQVLGYDLHLTLKTPNWVEQAKEEIGLCSSNTVPLYASVQPEYNCK